MTSAVSRRAPLAVVIGALAGAAFFIWMAGLKLIDPREVGWLMRFDDWQCYFLSWHLFRFEPWHMPPGRLVSEFFPVGTSIAYTDSVPLAALMLKPWSAFFPYLFQYFGLWLLICFAMQGACGALLLGCWTDKVAVCALGGLVLVLSPVLLNRLGHVALCAHWLILLAFWLYFRQWARGATARIAGWSVLVLVAALIQPYLWLMIMVLAVAAAVRYARPDRAYRLTGVVAHFGAIAAATAFGGWLGGWFVLMNAVDRQAGGLGYYSMNVLGPIVGNGMSSLMPMIPVFEGQTYEGFNYLGAGALMLGVFAAVLLARCHRSVSRPTALAIAPIGIACAILAVAALSHRITFANSVLWEIPLSGRTVTWLAAFRSSGRFFWPAGYLLTVGAIAIVVTRIRAPWASIVLAGAVILQVFDLHGRYLANRAVRSDASWYVWNDPSLDPFWADAARHRRHIAVVPPPACGVEPVPYAPMAWLAGRYGLTMNTGYAARVDSEALSAACRTLLDGVAAGHLDRDTIYVMTAADADRLKAAARAPVECHAVAGVMGCITRGAAP